ncbi:MAG: autotransporter outer membrane beta-barrel domain-containing protein [Alphaproteobacteria bacterium]|nr:autotransporter outer membrane beta-barrel domain-containing protein [Alphaproteobacteria bacterium]
MNKRILMLSSATIALLGSTALADTTISKATSTALTTSSAGNVTIDSGGSIAVSSASGAIKVDSNSFVSSAGGISNKDNTNATGILVDVTKNPDPLISTNTANTSAIGIDLLSGSSLTVNGTGTNHHGIWLQNTDATSTTIYTYTGPITFASGSTVSVTGDSSQALLIDENVVLHGNLTFGGTVSVTPSSTTTTSGTGTVGFESLGKVNGDVTLASGGTMTVTGAGATGMSVQGGGITGSLTVGGTMTISGQSASTNLTNIYAKPKVTGNPDAGPALAIGANVDGGIAILGPTATVSNVAAGSITVIGGGTSIANSPAAIFISPTVNSLYNATAPQNAPLTIGVFSDAADPGFSFVSRGPVAIQPSNVDEFAMAMHIAGASALYPTQLAGGFYNSGSMTAAATTTGTQVAGNGVVGIMFDNYTVLDNVSATYNYNTDPTVVSGGTGSTDATLAGKHGPTSTDPGDQAAFVNSGITGSGVISASTTGTRGGTAVAILINTLARVPSMINTGTISAAAATTDAALAGNTAGSTNPLEATAIQDTSGSLTYIYNGGTISACAGVSTSSTCSSMSALDNNSQVARAIDLSADTPLSAAGQGVTIISQSSLNKSATILGDVLFGTGDNQILTLQGNGPTHPSTLTGDVSFGLIGTGTDSGDQLNIGNYADLQGKVVAPSGVAVSIQNQGILDLLNTTQALNATTVHVYHGGALSLGVSESLTSSGVIAASDTVNIDSGANLGVAYSSFVPQGSSNFVLITAPSGKLNIDPSTVTMANTSLLSNVGSGGGSLPFLFQSAQLCAIAAGATVSCNGSTVASSTSDRLVLNVQAKTPVQLGLTGYAAQIFPYANTALGVDDSLGAAMVNGIHNAQDAQRAYAAFAPNVTGGTRAIAISITDQATGVVAARQRSLRMYGKEEGGTTLWADEFVQMIKDPGQGATQVDGTRAKSGFKDHGFGFSMGMDGGSPKYGWYGGAFTFYAGDVGEIERNSHENQQWYVLTAYSTWRGKGLFFDSKIDAGYGSIKGKRFINLNIPTSSGTTVYTREAYNKHAATMLSGGFSTGAMFSYGAATIMPQLSVDGLLLREDGYTESNPGTATVGDGFNLKVQPYYAQSLRAFLGADVRYDVDLWDFYLQPEARAGYRYDFFSDPVKLKAAFAHATTGVPATAGAQFILQGPDPSQGNFVVGGTLAATTDTWTMGLNFDLVKGSNGVLEEVGTLSILGRI